ncbi:hypothetical protein [Pseudonocardia phyllosphaerae]|uniref:hypothetical protein n=1 Tax=Pseudonocardia phyllosphaerae TaxID=3390502 RepID=UPI00397E5FF2
MTALQIHADRAAAPAAAGRVASDPAVAWHLVAHLERFWPSRRLDAFDEFCRPC